MSAERPWQVCSETRSARTASGHAGRARESPEKHGAISERQRFGRTFCLCINFCNCTLAQSQGRITPLSGQLLSLHQFDFSGDMLAKLEANERDLALHEQASGEKISDVSRVGTVLNRVTDTELATHLLLNSERFQTWPSFDESSWMSRMRGRQCRELTSCILESMIRAQHRWR